MDKDLELIKKRKFNRDISWEEIKQVLKRIGNKISKHKYILIYILFLFIVLFTTAQVIKTKTNFYSEELPMSWRNVLSYDDMYYARGIYNTYTDYTNHIGHLVKHPLFDSIARGFTIIENMVFDNDNPTDHYFHIVVFQIIINLIGIFYLYKILREHLKLKNKWCFLLITIYELATVTLLGTFVIDSFIFSGTLLIMSYYYLAKQKTIASIIVGILTAGITITNSIAFALMAIFLIKDKKKILKIGCGCIGGLLLVSLFLQNRDIIYNNLFSTVSNNMDLWVKDVGLLTSLKMAFFNIGMSPILFINILHTKLNGLDYVTFDLSAGILAIIMIIVYFIFIIFNAIRNIKDRNMLAALSVFIYNMLLHVVVRFGLYEGTIYGLHFLFAEIIMFAFGFKIKNKIFRRVFICFAILLLLVQIRYNMNGMLNLLLLFKDWK